MIVTYRAAVGALAARAVFSTEDAAPRPITKGRNGHVQYVEDRDQDRCARRRARRGALGNDRRTRRGAGRRENVRLATVQNEGIFLDGIRRFAELVGERTDGSVNIEVFCCSQLGGERQLADGVGLGTIEMSVLGATGSEIMDLLFTPFLFRDRQHALDVGQRRDRRPAGGEVLRPDRHPAHRFTCCRGRANSSPMAGRSAPPPTSRA